MKRTHLTIPFVVAALLASYYMLRSRTPAESPLVNQESQQLLTGSGQAPAPQPNAPISNPVTAAPHPGSSRPEALRSLAAMTGVLSKFSQPSQRVEDLLTFLKKQNAKPYVARSQDESIITRTSNPMNGTRYFYARYLGKDSSEHFLQHMSFEFEPSASAMADASAALRSSFKLTGKPSFESPDMVTWNLGNGYIAWVRKLRAADLDGHPYNAYSKEDVGTVKVAVEMDQEGGQ